MTTDRHAIHTASAAANAALETPVIGMFAGTHVVDGPDGPCDVNAIHVGIALLDQIANRAAVTNRRRAGETVFAVTMDGRPAGRLRYRSIVEEETRLKLYGVGLILPDDLVACVEPMTSASGVLFGVLFRTHRTTIELRTAPGMRPGRSRSR